MYLFLHDVYGGGISAAFNFGESKFKYPIVGTNDVYSYMNLSPTVYEDVITYLHGYK